jgi:hypothetical protein
MRHIKTYGDFVNESKTNEGLSDSFHNLYIAKEDITIKSGRKSIIIPKDTVITKIGGGYAESVDGSIKNLSAIDIEDNTGFTVVHNPVYTTVIDLTDEIENWAREVESQVQDNPKNAQKIIDSKMKIIDQIKKSLK